MLHVRVLTENAYTGKCAIWKWSIGKCCTDKLNFASGVGTARNILSICWWYCSQVNVAAPAGAIVSSARDMSRWMMWHLSGGAVPPTPGTTGPERRQLIDKDRLWETYRGRNTAFSRHSHQLTATNASDKHVAYDLGWITSYYRGNLFGIVLCHWLVQMDKKGTIAPSRTKILFVASP